MKSERVHGKVPTALRPGTHTVNATAIRRTSEDFQPKWQHTGCWLLWTDTHTVSLSLSVVVLKHSEHDALWTISLFLPLDFCLCIHFFSYSLTLMALSSCPSHAHSIKYVHGLIKVAYFVNLSHVKWRFVVLLNVIINMASHYIQIDSRWMFSDLV